MGQISKGQISRDKGDIIQKANDYEINFQGANVHWSKLQKANIKGANIWGANVYWLWSEGQISKRQASKGYIFKRQLSQSLRDQFSSVSTAQLNQKSKFKCLRAVQLSYAYREIETQSTLVNLAASDRWCWRWLDAAKSTSLRQYRRQPLKWIQSACSLHTKCYQVVL